MRFSRRIDRKVYLEQFIPHGRFFNKRFTNFVTIMIIQLLKLKTYLRHFLRFQKCDWMPKTNKIEDQKNLLANFIFLKVVVHK